EVGGGLLFAQLRERRNDAACAVENDDGVDGANVVGVLVPPERLQVEHGAAILREGLVEEVRGAILAEVDVFEVSDRARDGSINLGLVLWGKREGLREAAVLGAVDLAAAHQSDEVVLDGFGVALPSEGGGRLPGAREADHDDRLLALRRRDDLASGVHGQAALVVDDLVPHAQAALLRLAEVVGVEDARDAVLEVYCD